MFEDDFPCHKVGYVGSLEGIHFHGEHIMIASWGRFDDTQVQTCMNLYRQIMIVLGKTCPFELLTQGLILIFTSNYHSSKASLKGYFFCIEA